MQSGETFDQASSTMGRLPMKTPEYGGFADGFCKMECAASSDRLAGFWVIARKLRETI
jgi:hypothetical protein